MRGPKTVKGTLQAVRQLILRGWTRGVLARDKHGRQVHVGNERAVRYCLLGAIERVDGPAELKAKDLLAAEIAARTGLHNIWVFNDSRRRKREVLDVIDRVLASLKEVKN
jgi:hypothetical protein